MLDPAVPAPGFDNSADTVTLTMHEVEGLSRRAAACKGADEGKARHRDTRHQDSRGTGV